MSEQAIVCSALTKRYGFVLALDAFDLQQPRFHAELTTRELLR